MQHDLVEFGVGGGALVVSGDREADCRRGKTLRSLLRPNDLLISDPDLPMPSVFETSSAAIPITFVTKSSWDAIREALPPAQRQFATASAFAAKPGGYLALPAPDGAIAQILFGIEGDGARSRDLFRPGALPGLLPPGTYRFANAPHDARLAALLCAVIRPMTASS